MKAVPSYWFKRSPDWFDASRVQVHADGRVTRGSHEAVIFRASSESVAQELVGLLEGRPVYEHGILIEAFRRTLSSRATAALSKREDRVESPITVARDLLSRSERGALQYKFRS